MIKFERPPEEPWEPETMNAILNKLGGELIHIRLSEDKCEFVVDAWFRNPSKVPKVLELKTWRTNRWWSDGATSHPQTLCVPRSSDTSFPVFVQARVSSADARRASGRYLHLSALHSFHSSSLRDMASTACFVIVSKNHIPIYDAEVGSAPKKEDPSYQDQFILHAALDVVQDLAWATSAMFLKSVDRFNDLVVSVYVTAGHTRFMLLHDSRSEDGIKSFFQEVHELYIKIFLNPLYLPGSRITSSHFNTKVRALARKYL